MKHKAEVLLRVMVLAALVVSSFGWQSARAQGPGATWTVNPALPNDSACVAPLRACKLIQSAINAAAAGDLINVLPGTFLENLNVTKGVTLAGSGPTRTFVKPAVAASNLVTVGANNVTIAALTLDGDNPVGGAFEANNGVITVGGPFTGLQVFNTVVKNIAVNGFSLTGGTFNVRNNTVQNVLTAGFYATGASGQVSFNTFSNVADGIWLNASAGATVLNNTVTGSPSGIHTDYAAALDTIQANLVNVGTVGAFDTGIAILDPVVAPVVQGNTVDGIEQAMAVFGGGGVVTQLINNNLQGTGGLSSVGVYISTDVLGVPKAVSASLSGNTIQFFDVGVFAWQDVIPGASPAFSAVLRNNNVSFNVWGVDATNVDTTLVPLQVDAAFNWWGSGDGPGLPALAPNNDAVGQVTVAPWALSLVASATASLHEIGEIGTLNSNVTGLDVYGIQMQVNHNPAVLTFSTGLANSVPAAGWFWDFIVDNFTAAAGATRLSGTMMPPNTIGANLAGESVATWNYTCTGLGDSQLMYDSTPGTGTELSDSMGLPMNAALTGGSITCIAATSAVDGYMKLQGRLGTNPAPKGWEGAEIRMSCVSGCVGSGPYVMTSNSTGLYNWAKAGPGTGVTSGVYALTVTRRAYLPATKLVNVTVAGAPLTINPVGTAPMLLGGDVSGDGKVTMVDITSIGASWFMVVTPDTGADINGDGRVNIYDLVLAGGNYFKTSSVWP